MPQQVCGQRRGRTTPFFIILAVVEEAPFRQQRNTSSLIQCDRYFKPDVSHTWAPFLLQVGWQVSIHTSHTIMLVDDISVLLARVVDTYDYLHSKLGLFWFIRRHVRSLKSILSLDCDTGDASEITKHWISKVDQVVFSCRRPRWLGRLSSCLLKSISRVQFSPSAHTRRDFSLHKKMISGKRESVS